MKAFKKDILPHQEFYIVRFTKSSNLPYALFIHGGPGLNCGTIEYLIEHHNLFNSLQCNIILYDQRNCGKSNKIKKLVLQQDNINDLQKIILYLDDHFNLNIHALIGHSYGAKLLFDYYKNYESTIPGVFVSTAQSILTPRLNNLMLDLSYLKKSNLELYNKILNEINNLDLNKIWELSEQLTPVFQENKDRPYLYWANLDYYNLVQNAHKNINLPLDMNTFISVRKDLYSKEANFSVNINELKIRKLWINGFHDFVMNGHQIALNNHEIITFNKSSHYPHLEENDRFSELLNEFIK
ncbi:TPA: alpha/beta hydrolase [Legionella anisa]|uniref:Alpha/beta hydrolase n=1 Tax=Legionella anisa TaxID=28082 RepID=A0AAX0WT40_9GAMM|nr:alpha/beta hydrolase [Legionella anisa]AWN74928.1 alpha/beta hydrolase [Legionella anisa]MCW8424868.1 alpha/beta hydrolase [Legionella anisa]MCW8446013.1 alpha/beta hydrolase [Legionella anisa]PNL61113.1 alpha/beta hydrolase [Legionella anisa]UAK80141.1 alpha/beta hydrolase [Legionella anisa]